MFALNIMNITHRRGVHVCVCGCFIYVYNVDHSGNTVPENVVSSYLDLKIIPLHFILFLQTISKPPLVHYRSGYDEY